MRFLQVIIDLEVLFVLFITTCVSGQVFSSNIQVDEGLVSTQYVPKILCGDDRALSVTWVDTRDGDYNIYFSRSMDGGRTWITPNVRISDRGTGGYGSRAPMVIDENGTIYTTWDSYQHGDDHIFFSKSSDRGDTWIPDVQVDDNSVDSKKAPTVCLGSNGDIYVTWEDFRSYDDTDIYFARSTDGGETWTNPNIRVNEDTAGYQRLPSMAIDPWGDLYVAYDCHTDIGYSHIYLVKSTDGGDTWSWPHVQVDDGQAGNHYFPKLAVGQDGRIYASWSYWGQDHILFAKSTDSGETWSRPNIQVDYAPSNYFWNDHSSLAVDEAGNIYVTWDAYNYYDAYPDIFVGMSTDGGEAWTNPSLMVNDGTYLGQSFPAIAAGGDQQAYVVWRDSRGGEDISINGIYFSRTVPVLAYVEADETLIPPGGNLGVKITLINETGVDQTAEIWTGMLLLTGGMYDKERLMYGPEAFTLTPYDTIFEHIDHKIPSDAPLGEYEYWVKVDDDRPYYEPPYRFETDPDRYYLFKDSFTFTVVDLEQRAIMGLSRR